MPGYTLITAAKIQDSTGRLLSSGRVTFFPTNNHGEAVSAVAGGGGMILSKPVTFLVVNGSITTDLFGNTPQVADTSLTTPANICYRITVTDDTNETVQGPGYGLAQPSGASWSLDTYVPVQPALVTIIQGAPGPPGTSGFTVSSVAVSGTLDGTNAVFTLAQAPPAADNLDLFLSGLYQTPGIDYTLSGSTVTFTPPPASTDVIAAKISTGTGSGGGSAGTPFASSPIGSIDGSNASSRSRAARPRCSSSPATA